MFGPVSPWVKVCRLERQLRTSPPSVRPNRWEQGRGAALPALRPVLSGPGRENPSRGAPLARERNSACLARYVLKWIRLFRPDGREPGSQSRELHRGPTGTRQRWPIGPVDGSNAPASRLHFHTFAVKIEPIPQPVHRPRCLKSRDAFGVRNAESQGAKAAWRER